MRSALFYVSTILILSLLIALVITLSTNKKLLPQIREKVLIKVPSTRVTYSEHNVSTARIHCASLYATLPDPAIEGNTHVSDILKQDNAVLSLTNEGVLEYAISGEKIWKSSSPRQYHETVVSKSMLYIPVKDWIDVVTCGNVSLSIVPLAVKRKQGLHWTYVSGFEPVCTSKPDCPLTTESKAAMGGTVFLFSKNRRYRAALLFNGDVVVLNKQSEKPGSHILKEELASSLITGFCTSESSLS